jgi:hypothetical protein
MPLLWTHPEGDGRHRALGICRPATDFPSYVT